MPVLTRFIPAVVLLSLVLTGCGGIPIARQVAQRTTAGDYSAALALMDKHKAQYSGANNMLYYFDHGSLLQRLGDYSASNEDLQKADLLIDELYGTSVSQAATSLLVNDMSMDYVGEDFEQVMVNTMKTLNYLYSQNLADATVEARKVDTRLKKIADKYGRDAVYQQDAFARYLAGFAREAEGDENGAYIDYKMAYQAYQVYAQVFGMPIPSLVCDDLLRLSRRLGFDDEYREWQKAFGEENEENIGPHRHRTELLLVIYDGSIPEKYTRYVTAPTEDRRGHSYLLKVAFPALRIHPNVVRQVRVGLPDGTVRQSQLMEPLDAIATKTLEQRIAAISAKAILRAIAKYKAAEAAREAMKTGDAGVNALVNIATNVFTYATEQADTRSWQILPSRFHLVRIPLPPGNQQLEVRVETIYGAVNSLPPVKVELKKGEKKVIPIFITN